jgi:hypothetical protein
MTQAIRQNLGADAIDVPFERARPFHAIGDRTQNTNGPTAPDYFLKQYGYSL